MPVVLVAPVVVGLMALLSFLILYGVRRQAAALFGNLFTLLGNALNSIPFVGGWLRSHVVAATQWMENAIGNAATTTAEPITAFFSHLAGVIEYAAFTTAYIAESTYDALWKLRHGVIPRLIRGAIRDTVLLGGKAGALGRWIAREIGAAEAELSRTFRHALAQANAAVAAAGHALDRGLALDIPGALRSIYDRLSRTEKLVIGGAFAAGIVRVIARRLPWYRCGNVNKAARNLCRTDTDLLDSLFADTLILAGSISLVEFASECQKVMPYVEQGVSRFVREVS